MESNKRRKPDDIEQTMVQLLKKRALNMFQPLNSLKLQVSAEAVFILDIRIKYDLIELSAKGLFQKLETILRNITMTDSRPS